MLGTSSFLAGTYPRCLLCPAQPMRASRKRSLTRTLFGERNCLKCQRWVTSRTIYIGLENPWPEMAWFHTKGSGNPWSRHTKAPPRPQERRGSCANCLEQKFGHFAPRRNVCFMVVCRSPVLLSEVFFAHIESGPWKPQHLATAEGQDQDGTKPMLETLDRQW